MCIAGHATPPHPLPAPSHCLIEFAQPLLHAYRPLTASAPVRLSVLRMFAADVQEVDAAACTAGEHGVPSSRMVVVGRGGGWGERCLGLVISGDGPLRYYVATEQHS